MISILDIPKLRHVTAKLGTMRKAREWLPQRAGDGRVIVQTSGAIGIFDAATGRGRLCIRGEYFHHLALAQPIVFPPDFVGACLDALDHAKQFEVSK